MESRLENIERKVDEQGHTLKEMAKTLQALAVQEHRLATVETQQSTLWRKYDALVDPNIGQLPKIVQWQASCPRTQIKFLWWFVATVDFGLLVVLVSLLAKISGAEK